MAKREIDSKLKKVLESCHKEVGKFFDVAKFFLFGSYASGKESCDSDIDIAVVCDNLKNRILDGAKMQAVLSKIDNRIEPHAISKEDFDSVADPFIKEIIETGIQIA